MLKFIVRVFKYTFARGMTLLLMVAVSVFIMVLIANLGGHVDTLIRNNITESLGSAIQGGWLEDITDNAERERIFNETRLTMEEAAGLNQPFLLRCLRWTWNGMTLDWGVANQRITFFGIPTHEVRILILDHLPRTLLIFGVANFLLLCSTVVVALSLTRRYGGFMDRVVTFLSPMAAAPSWIYGLVLAAISIHLWHTTYNSFTEWPRTFEWSHLPFYARHMLPPIVAIFLSKFFQSVYAWRTFFLIHSTEEYVEMARAKGLEGRLIEQRYILRPALPNVLTSFALMVINLWQDVILLETIFAVGGVGRLFYAAMVGNDVRLIVGLVVTFAYLLAITVFVLDIAYALVDPRVKVGGESQSASAVVLDQRPAWWQVWRRAQSPAVRAEIPPGWRQSSRGSLSSAESNLSSPVVKRIPLKQRLLQGWNLAREMTRYPSVIFGTAIIVMLVSISVYTVVTIPYKDAVSLWRGDHTTWDDNPDYALPAWTNLFRKDPLPETIVVNSQSASVHKTRQQISEDMTEISMAFPLDYPYAGGFPQDWALYFDVSYTEKRPHVSLAWLTPDGRELDLGSFSVTADTPYYPFRDASLKRKLGVENVREAMLGDPADPSRPLSGHYELRLKSYVFEKDADIDGRLILYGQVYGLAGTDGDRRDVLLGLLWGTPIALTFGLLAAVGTSLSTMSIAAIGAWFGGRVDGVIQRLTEVNMLIPFFPVSLMIYTLYSKSFWVILGVTVLLSIFGSGIKNYRAVFLQLKESPYIEAARSYGTGDWRLIARYLIPRVSSTLVPQLVMLVPSYVFLEAGLAALGLYDPLTPPTWGQLVLNGLSKGVYNGAYHLVFEPAILLVLTGSAFLFLGFSLERILDPRLRRM